MGLVKQYHGGGPTISRRMNFGVRLLFVLIVSLAFLLIRHSSDAGFAPQTGEPVTFQWSESGVPKSLSFVPEGYWMVGSDNTSTGILFMQDGKPTRITFAADDNRWGVNGFSLPGLDLNSDGVVNVIDVIILMQIVVGL